MPFAVYVNAVTRDADFSRPTFANHAAVFYLHDLNLATLVAWIVVVQNLPDVQHFYLRDRGAFQGTSVQLVE